MKGLQWNVSIPHVPDELAGEFVEDATDKETVHTIVCSLGARIDSFPKLWVPHGGIWSAVPPQKFLDLLELCLAHCCMESVQLIDERIDASASVHDERIELASVAAASDSQPVVFNEPASSVSDVDDIRAQHARLNASRAFAAIKAVQCSLVRYNEMQIQPHMFAGIVHELQGNASC